MPDTCAECRFNKGGYCVIKEKDVKSGNKACPEFEER